MSKSPFDTVLPGENILWSTFTTSPAEDLISPELAKIIGRVAYGLLIAVFALSTWTIYQARGRFEPKDLWFPALFIASFLVSIGIKKRFGTPTWNMQFGPDVFTNAVITDQRIMLEGHAEPPHYLEIAKAQILSAKMDYEQGGLALKITSRGSTCPAVLVGMADFKRATKIIQTRLIKGASS